MPDMSVACESLFRSFIEQANQDCPSSRSFQAMDKSYKTHYNEPRYDTQRTHAVQAACERIPECITRAFTTESHSLYFPRLDAKMHHALLISEVSREICAELDQPSLPALARTCRALHDTALDELWRELYSIHPYIHLLWALTGLGETRRQPHLTSQQWMTLRKYSARTRSLYLSTSFFFCGLECLSDPPDPDSFFPNLQTVEWYPDNYLAVLPFFRLLCGPALTSLSAEFDTDPASLSMVAALGSICPNITHIWICASSETLSRDLMNALSTSICHWKDLKHFSCDDLTVSVMEHLGRARNLESFAAYASSPMLSSSQSLSVQELSFPSLQHLHLHMGFSMVIDCLRCLRLTLKDFRLDLFDARDVFPASPHLRDLLTTLAEACSHASLTRLNLYVTHLHFSSPSPVATIRDIRPLFSFTNLRIVSLDGFFTFVFNDDDIAVLASAWPCIEELALSTYVDHPVASLPTFQSLFHLARSCPKLTALSLVVDMWELITPFPCVVGCDVRSTILHDLRLGNSPISSPIAVAHMLRNLYPALKQVDMSVWNRGPLDHLPHQDRYEAYWETVNIELQNLKERDE